MKKLLIIALVAIGLVGCTSSKTEGAFDMDVRYIGYAESKGEDITPGDVPIPSSITFKLWHAIDHNENEYIATKIEEKILWIIPLEYGQHIWKVRPGEWDDPGHQLGKAYDWVDLLDRNLEHKVNMKCIGHGATWKRTSDGYVEGFTNDYKCWLPK